MNEQQKKLESFLNERITACKQHSKLLAEENRKDEGNFEKIRTNVYEIFKTILSAAEKVCGKDDLSGKHFFLQKMEQIPQSWAISYEKAKKYRDTEKMHIESIKLDTVREIKDMCMQIWEENI